MYTCPKWSTWFPKLAAFFEQKNLPIDSSICDRESDLNPRAPLALLCDCHTSCHLHVIQSYIKSQLFGDGSHAWMPLNKLRLVGGMCREGG